MNKLTVISKNFQEQTIHVFPMKSPIRSADALIFPKNFTSVARKSLYKVKSWGVKYYEERERDHVMAVPNSHTNHSMGEYNAILSAYTKYRHFG